MRWQEIQQSFVYLQGLQLSIFSRSIRFEGGSDGGRNKEKWSQVIEVGGEATGGFLCWRCLDCFPRPAKMAAKMLGITEKWIDCRIPIIE